MSRVEVQGINAFTKLSNQLLLFLFFVFVFVLFVFFWQNLRFCQAVLRVSNSIKKIICLLKAYKGDIRNANI